MPYREDDEALHARNDSLEAEVERLRAERDDAVDAQAVAEGKRREAQVEHDDDGPRKDR